MASKLRLRHKANKIAVRQPLNEAETNCRALVEACFVGRYEFFEPAETIQQSRKNSRRNVSACACGDLQDLAAAGFQKADIQPQFVALTMQELQCRFSHKKLPRYSLNKGWRQA